jgi:hypothetical protein
MDMELNKVGLQRIMNFHYNVGNCLFYIISYLLKYSLTLSTIQQNSMGYSQECLVLGTLEALNYPRLELNEKNLHGLHHGQTINEKSYIYKMSIQMMDFGVILLMYFGH